MANHLGVHYGDGGADAWAREMEVTSPLACRKVFSVIFTSEKVLLTLLQSI